MFDRRSLPSRERRAHELWSDRRRIVGNGAASSCHLAAGSCHRRSCSCGGHAYFAAVPLGVVTSGTIEFEPVFAVERDSTRVVAGDP